MADISTSATDTLLKLGLFLAGLGLVSVPFIGPRVSLSERSAQAGAPRPCRPASAPSRSAFPPKPPRPRAVPSS